MTPMNSYITHGIMSSHWGRKVHWCMYDVCKAMIKIAKYSFERKWIYFIYPFYTVFLFFSATNIDITHVWPCIMAFGKEWTTNCGRHERFKRISWWNLCPTHFVGQVFMFQNHIKAYRSMGYSVFINNVKWEVKFEVPGLIFCNCNDKFLFW